MVSVRDAKNIVRENCVALQPVKSGLGEASDMILAEDVYATLDIPAFPQSSMDGYAFLFNEWQANKQLAVEGEIAAGTNKEISLASGKVVRIFTGAPVPSGADTVVMQEKVRLDPQTGAAQILIIEDDQLKQGMNVRPKGSEMKAGGLALEKGSLLSPAAIGFLAGIGITELCIFPNPSVSIVITGNELQQPGKALQYGQVYESNSYTLTAALHQLGIDDVKLIWAEDNFEKLKSALGSALEQSDIILLTGGISVGDYDFVLQAATAWEVSKMFHKVKQRPGKPLYFGMKGSKPVFGLPGNPSSVLTCFYEYVLPAIEKLTNRKTSLKEMKVPLAKSIQKTAGLTQFLKGSFDGTTARALEAQESFRLSSFAKANCLVVAEEHLTEINQGEWVEIHLLPF